MPRPWRHQSQAGEVSWKMVGVVVSLWTESGRVKIKRKAISRGVLEAGNLCGGENDRRRHPNFGERRRVFSRKRRPGRGSSSTPSTICSTALFYELSMISNLFLILFCDYEFSIVFL